jgi:hypothetical protein
MTWQARVSTYFPILNDPCNIYGIFSCPQPPPPPRCVESNPLNILSVRRDRMPGALATLLLSVNINIGIFTEMTSIQTLEYIFIYRVCNLTQRKLQQHMHTCS